MEWKRKEWAGTSRLEAKHRGIKYVIKLPEGHPDIEEVKKQMPLIVDWAENRASLANHLYHLQSLNMVADWLDDTLVSIRGDRL